MSNQKGNLIATLKCAFSNYRLVSWLVGCFARLLWLPLFFKREQNVACFSAKPPILTPSTTV